MITQTLTIVGPKCQQQSSRSRASSPSPSPAPSVGIILGLTDNWLLQNSMVYPGVSCFPHETSHCEVSTISDKLIWYFIGTFSNRVRSMVSWARASIANCSITRGYHPKAPYNTEVLYWLLVLTILKNISQWEGLSHIYIVWKKWFKPPISVRHGGFLSHGGTSIDGWSNMENP